MSRIDEAVERNLRMKFQLGLFEEPYLDEDKRQAGLHNAEAVDVARRVANESIVLLKNNGVLPLSKDIRKVAVVGPNCDYPRLGGYTPKGCEEYSVSPLEGIKNIIGEDRIVTAKGCCVVAPSDLDAAIKAAEESDVVVAVLGDNSSAWFAKGWGDDEGGNIITCGEGKDTSSLALPDVQKELLRALKKVGKPIVLVLETGRPYAIMEENDIADALLAAWYPGEQGGNALADILFGNVNPSGKLPITFPKTVGHIPCFYNYKAMARTPHLDVNAAPNENFDKRKINMAALYEFGFGLSYTTFAYSDLKVEGETVSVKVTNTGDRVGKETVLMYLVHEYCPVTRFVKRLRNFTKIELQPGETKEVTFTIVDEDLSYVGIDYKTYVGTGEFTVLIGGLEGKYYR
jgi:beta-glucosidase